MTPRQEFTVAYIGGLAALISLMVVAALGYGLHIAFSRLADWHEARRRRRRDLKTCRAIDALGTTHKDHPKR